MSYMNESLDSRKLNAFVVLARTGSYTKTAKELFVTHSAICHSMRQLEADIGCRLFINAGKKITLTEAGEALLTHAQRVLDELEQARQSMNYLNKWGTRRLRVAAEAIFLSVFLTPVLLKFHKESPGTLLYVQAFDADDSFSLLEKNQVDVILTEKPANH